MSELPKIRVFLLALRINGSEVRRCSSSLCSRLGSSNWLDVWLHTLERSSGTLGRRRSSGGVLGDWLLTLADPIELHILILSLSNRLNFFLFFLQTARLIGLLLHDYLEIGCFWLTFLFLFLVCCGHASKDFLCLQAALLDQSFLLLPLLSQFFLALTLLCFLVSSFFVLLLLTLLLEFSLLVFGKFAVIDDHFLDRDLFELCFAVWTGPLNFLDRYSLSIDLGFLFIVNFRIHWGRLWSADWGSHRLWHFFDLGLDWRFGCFGFFGRLSLSIRFCFGWRCLGSGFDIGCSCS